MCFPANIRVDLIGNSNMNMAGKYLVEQGFKSFYYYLEYLLLVSTWKTLSFKIFISLVPCLSSRTSEPFCLVCQEKLEKEFILLSSYRITTWKQRGENKNEMENNIKNHRQCILKAWNSLNI